MTITRVVIYCRVSTKDKGQDVENQLRQLREFCAKQGYPIVREYVDHASGKHSDRDAFRKMFAAASRHEFDMVLFWALDRFSREGVFDTLQHLQRLTTNGVGYRSYTEQYLDSCGMFRDAVVGILATVARQERIRLSERTVAGLERAKAQGRVGGRPRVICDRKRVLGLRKAGKSLGQIAADLRLSKPRSPGSSAQRRDTRDGVRTMMKKKATATRPSKAGKPQASAESTIALTVKLDGKTYVRLSTLRAKERTTAQDILTAALKAYLDRAGA